MKTTILGKTVFTSVFNSLQSTRNALVPFFQTIRRSPMSYFNTFIIILSKNNFLIWVDYTTFIFRYEKVGSSAKNHMKPLFFICLSYSPPKNLPVLGFQPWQKNKKGLLLSLALESFAAVFRLLRMDQLFWTFKIKNNFEFRPNVESSRPPLKIRTVSAVRGSLHPL